MQSIPFQGTAMTKTHSLIIGASITLGCLILNLQHSTPVAGQVGQLPQSSHGQYQMMPVSGPGYCYVFVTDSKTGQTWKRDGMNANGEWQSLGSPAK
jgi:hypothetical protein